MNVDFLVIGAGISGAAAAYELSQHGSVVVLEAESTPGYHSTGRSAALYTPNYGNELIRKINQASHSFYKDPPDEFAEGSLLTDRGFLTIAGPGREHELESVLALSTQFNEIVPLDTKNVLEMAPLLSPGVVAAAAYEHGVMDMDVAAIHQGYLNGAARRGGKLICNASVQRLEHLDGDWHVRAGDERYRAHIVVNAAGAWAEKIGALAKAQSIGLVAKRRTAIIVEAPPQMTVASMPAIDFIGVDNYLKPDAGKIMASPGDATPMEPQDIQPDELDVAGLVDWLERNTRLDITRVDHRWAGLRSFVADDSPVVGFDSQVANFFWLAGQGGYGIMMASALARTTAGLVCSGELPKDLELVGVTKEQLMPARLI